MSSSQILPPPEGPEYTPCRCSHIEPEHEPNAGECYSCDCVAYRPVAAPTDEDFLVALEAALEKNLLPDPGFAVLEATRDDVVAALAPLVARLRPAAVSAVRPPATDRTACRTTQHCAYHGWCRRCAPAFAAVMSAVNVAIQRTDVDESHWGPLYEAVGRALRDAVLPEPADRAAVLRDAEDAVEGLFIEDENPDERSLGFNAALDEVITELRRLAAEPAAAGPDQTDETPVVCEGFQWIGQSFATCDRCGQPAWDHAGQDVPVEGAGPFDYRRTVRLWEPGEADAIRAKWGTPTAAPAVGGAQQWTCKCPPEICQCGHHAQQPKEA